MPSSRVTVWACSVKSHRSTSPASSTARRRCISPQRPRTCGLRSAVDSVWVSRRSVSVAIRMSSTCSLSWPCQLDRWWSRSRIWSLSRSRPWSSSARSTPASTTAATYVGRERTQSTPTVAPRTSPRHNISTIVITMLGSLQVGTDTGIWRCHEPA